MQTTDSAPSGSTSFVTALVTFSIFIRVVEPGVFKAIFVIPFFSMAIFVGFIALHVFFAIVLVADFLRSMFYIAQLLRLLCLKFNLPFLKFIALTKESRE